MLTLCEGEYQAVGGEILEEMEVEVVDILEEISTFFRELIN